MGRHRSDRYLAEAQRRLPLASSRIDWSRLPRNLLIRAAVAAALCAVVLALPLALVLPMLGDGLLTPGEAIGSKAVITALFSLIIVPLVAYATIGDVSAAKGAAR